MKGIYNYSVVGNTVIELSDVNMSHCGSGCVFDSNSKVDIRGKIKGSIVSPFCRICNKYTAFASWEFFTPTKRTRQVMKAMRLQVNYGK